VTPPSPALGLLSVAAFLLGFGCSNDTGVIDPARGGTGGAPGAGGQGTAGSGVGGNGGVGGSSVANGGSSPGTSGAGSGGSVAGTSASGGAAGAGQGGSTPAGGSAGEVTAGRAGSSNSGSAGKLGNGGAGGSGGGAGGLGSGGEGDEPPDDEIPPGYVKGIIGVGYGGLRILSRDGGRTWGDRKSIAANGGDDENLIRAITYGEGRWVAMGWNLWTSDDGLEWDDRGRLDAGILSPNPIIEGLAYKDGYFYAAGDGDPSRIFRSADGLAWEAYGRGGDTVKHTGLSYRGGLFVSFGDSGTSYQSADALTWTEMTVTEATYCENAWKTLSQCHDATWFADGFYLSVEWGGQIRRSTNGENFETVYEDSQENTLYKACAMAEGYVAPE
jgi:hypothetical protein